MKVLFYTLFISTLFSNFASSQQVTIEGSVNSTSHLYGPLHTLNAAPRSYRSSFIYNESLLTTMLMGSTINQLQFSRSNNGPALPAGNNLKLYLMNTTINTWGTTALPWDVSGATLVFDGDPSALIGTTAGYKQFPLFGNFVYSGNNIVLYSEYSQVAAPSTTISWHYNTPASQPAYIADQGKYTVNSNLTMPATLNTTTGNHANMIINYTPPPACDEPPIPGSTTASVTDICSGNPVRLNLSGGSIGSGQNYIWQSFTSAGGPYTNINTASPSAKLDINPTSTAFYRVAITCGATTVFTDSIQVRVAPLFASGTYTINSLLPTSGTNFNSFSDAVNAFKCGITGAVTFNVDALSGPYNEQITIPQITGASATNTITFNGNGRQLTYNQNGTGTRAVITLDGADYITINNLNIDATSGTYGWGIQLMNNADYNTISNSTVVTSSTNTVNANHTGIIIGGTSTTPTATGNSGRNNMIINNTVTGGYYGIVLSGNTAAGAQSLNNVISGNTVQEVYSYSIYLAYQSGAQISGNDISRPTRVNSTTTAGVYLGTGNINTLVEKNRIHNMFDAITSDASILYGIHVSSDGTAAQVNKLVNNIIYNNTFNGIFYGIYNTGGDYMQVYHNTIVAIDSSIATTGATYGIFVSGTVTGVDIKNNILYINRSGTGIKRVFYFVSLTSTISSNHNIFFFNDRSGGSDNHIGQWGTSLYITLADWKTANNNAFDQLSVHTDPLFTNYLAGDFLPKEPVVDNLGTPVGITTDINGTSRSATAPDAGAYEFTPAACSGTPVPGTSMASPTGVVCPSAPLILTLVGNSLGATQTYQWQSSATLVGGYTNITAASDYKTTTIFPTTTLYYRAAVTCGSITEYSTPIQVVVASYFPAGTYTINSANPTGSGNYQNFNDAVSAIRCGVTGAVTFNVEAGSGPYNEQITIPYIVGTSSSNPITFNGNGTTIQFNSFSEGRHIIKLEGAKNIVFNNLKIVGLNNTYGWGVHLRKAADSNTINNCIIDMSLVISTVQNNSAGIAATYSSTSAVAEGNNANYNMISGNTIIGAHTGIGLYGIASSLQLNKRNTITGNTIRDFYANGMLIMWNDSAVITNNNIHRANRTGAVGIFSGIELRAGCKNAVVNANRIHSTHNASATQTGAAYGIFMNLCDAPTGQENKITNNLIYNFNSLSGTIYGLYNSTSDGVLYYHNTVVIDNTSSTSGTTHGFSEQTNLGFAPVAHGHMTLMNNLFYINRGGSGEKVALSFLTTPNEITSNYNNLFNNSELNGNIAKLGATIYPTLATWKAAAGGLYDQQSVNFNPAFVNPGTDFTPTSTDMDNRGTFVGITTDLLGASRSLTTPDIGAIEYNTVVPVTLLQFTGHKYGAINRLEWKTATEINNAGFELERSNDGLVFSVITFIPSKSIDGNSNSILSYNHDDVGQLPETGYYRLKQIDRDGRISYSKIVIIKTQKTNVLSITSLYPNPVSDILNLNVDVSARGKVTLTVIDITGKVLMEQVEQVVAGINSIKVSVNQLAAGAYVLRSSNQANETVFIKFIKQ